MTAPPTVRPHVDGRQIAASIAGLSGLLALTQQLASALAEVAQPVQDAAEQGMDPAEHYRMVAQQKAAHAARALTEVHSAAAAVAQAAAAGAALVQPPRVS